MSVCFMYSTAGHSGQIVMELEIPRQILQKYPNIKINENPLSWSRVV